MTQTLKYGGQFAYSRLNPGEPERPYLVVRVHGKGNFFDTYGLLDSGADNTLFNDQWASVLGLTLDPTKAQLMGGVGGRAQVWYFDLYLTVNSKRFATRVGFAATCPREFGLLGRNSTFGAFRFGFEHKEGKVLYHPVA
jgi:hypothetical protein